MSERTPLWLESGAHPAEDVRLGIGALLASTGALSTRTGVRPSSGDPLKVAQLGTPGMGVLVNAGSTTVQGTRSTQQGVYILTLDAQETVNVPDSHPTLARIDLIVFKARDAYYAGSDNDGLVTYVQGTPAGSPTAPAVPDDTIALAQVLVGAAVSSITNANITDLRVYTTALGGIIPCLSTARPATPYEGMGIYETDTDAFFFYNGASWLSVGATDRKPLCRVSRAAAQSIPDATLTSISWDTELTDTDSMWASSPNPTRITAVRAGWHRVTAHISWVGNSGGTRFIAVNKNGTSDGVRSDTQPLSSSTFSPPSYDNLIYLAVGDYLEVQVRQSSGGSLSTTDGPTNATRVCVIWERV